jgi:ferrous iron transport protein A
VSNLTLGDVAPGARVIVARVGGARAFRRRLMELGVIPGTLVEVLRVAPLGDPVELSARGCNLSIRRAEAKLVDVQASGEREASKVPADARLVKGLS